ncbi:MAG: Gfo/Idh/MocA family oxidoreductase, partial [Clostridiales bacterium]|nr:Gfo/Idh/MocA family oxidoreductase [Clostridiales bacterium]
MLKVGLVGIGFMGRGHLEQYIRLMGEGAPVELVALCDVDPKKFETGAAQGGNLGSLGMGDFDLSRFRVYHDFDDMVAGEQLDYVDLALPTFLHCYYACRAMEAGLHVLCEKPMALNPEQCQMMIDAAERTGKRLMIAQCLRFWPAYEALKELSGGSLGAPVSAYFYRGGGGIPQWSHQNWLKDEFRSGGCLLDQHVHDVDMVNFLFGLPEAVSTLGRNVFPGAGIDAVSTHYRYPGDFTVTTEDDWSMSAMPFQMMFRVNFERGAVAFDGGKATVYPVGGQPYQPEQSDDSGYYREIRYFIDKLISGQPIETCTPDSAR